MPALARPRKLQLRNGASRRGQSRAPEMDETRFGRRLGEILEHATHVFYEKGYAGASMRDLSRSSGMSLAGLYYYFESKEKLLYLVQRHTFRTVIARLREHLQGEADPQQRLRIFIANHLEYFLANLQGMTVLSHEDEALKNGYGTEIAALKREYYQICLGLIDDLRRACGGAFRNRMSSRVAVMSLFGMMNWIYTWHSPRTDPGARELARQMGDTFLCGVLGGAASMRHSARGERNGAGAGVGPVASARNRKAGRRA